MSQDVLNSIQSAWANSTKNNLKHQKSVYIRFCDRMGFKELPVSVFKLSLFIQELANQNFKVTTIKNYVSSVKLFHVLSGYSASVFDSELIRLLFKGLSRIQLRGPNQVAPITPKILLQIHACLDLTQQSDITFWSFLVLSFLLMACKSNLVPDSVAGFDAKKQLTWQDVKFGNGPGECYWFHWNGQRRISFLKRCMQCLWWRFLVHPCVLLKLFQSYIGSLHIGLMILYFCVFV